MLKLIGIRGGRFCLLISAIVSLSASFCAFAGSAAADGADFVVSADSGETYTYSTAVGNYNRLVKRGAGEVELTAASSDFAGSVVVEAGTLTISHVDAVGGSSVKIEVNSGTTLWLKVPGKGQNSNVAFPHDVTIAGKGVGNNGALRYTNTSSTYADSLLNSLTLSADATIDVSSRWGMGNGKILDLKGHTLTRIGAGNWMIYNHIQSTGAPGEVNNVYGTLTMQGTPDIDENVTVVVTNVSESSCIGMWGVTSSDTIKGPIKLYSGRNIQAQSGTEQKYNHIGPLHLAGPNKGQATLTSQYEKDKVVYARTMSVDGPITSDTGMGLAVSGKGSVWFNGDVSISSGTTYVQGTGNLYLSGEDSRRDMKLALRGSTTTTHEAGRTYLRMLRVANGGTAASGEKAQLRQTGGVIGVGSGDSPRIGETPGHRAYYTLEGGKLFTSNLVYVAEKAGSFGAVRQTGGYFESYRSPNSEGSAIIIGRGGNALFVQTGGTNDFSHANSKGDQNFRVGIGSTNGVAEVTISGKGTEFRTSGLVLGGASTAPSTNILNLASGAKLKVNRFKKHENANAKTLSVVNADGGILAPTFSWGLTASVSEAKRNPDHFVVWENGFIVDTTENATKNSSGADATTLTFHFDKPTGKGVESITLPDLSDKTYIGIGRIVIEDETGWGASAYAEFDFATKKLTNAVITSRGCNYSDNAKAYLESPDGKARYVCGITLTSNDGKCGPLVKRGEPGLILNSADSTIDGGYTVEDGELALGVVPSVAVPVSVENGATLNLNSKGALTASTFAGAGTVTNGNVTVTNAVCATCADIFAGKAAAFSGNLTLAADAVFEITDAENLADYKEEKRAVALTAGGSISRLPQLRLTTSDGSQVPAGDWTLRLSADGKSLKFGCDKGLLIIIK